MSNGLESLFTNNRNGITSIVIPVMNESENVMALVRRVHKACKGLSVEILYIDDSKDTDTVEAVAFAQKQYGGDNFSVGIYHRTGDNVWGGLSGSVTDGIRMAKSDHIIVMDGDLQHPPELIPEIIEEGYRYDVVVASRYIEGGSAGGLDGGIRHFVSRFSTYLAKSFFPSRLRGVTDPMTGFFMIDRTQIDLTLLRPKGFKILLEILATHSDLTRVQVPLQFAERFAGESNTSLKQGMTFFVQLAMLKVVELVRLFVRLPKFVQFAAIGGSVFVVGMAILYVLVEFLGMSPFIANGIQLAVTFILNYLLNRYLTWGERDVSDMAIYKFIASRSFTSILNYYLFVLLFTQTFNFTALGQSISFSIGYLAANFITLIIITILNFAASDLWAFAEMRKPATVNQQYVDTVDSVSSPHIAARFENMEVKPAPMTTFTGGVMTGPQSSQKVYRFEDMLLFKISRKINTYGLAIGLPLSIVIAILFAPAQTAAILLSIAGVFLFVQSSVEVWRMLYAYREPEAVDRLKFPTAYDMNENFCVIVPARHESQVLGDTLTNLARQTHPSTHIITVMCDDDKETLKEAYRVAVAHPNITVMQYPLLTGVKPSKPKQLNYVFEHIKDDGYTAIGIFDAEDTVHPELLEHVDAAFADKDISIVQAGVQLMNHDSSWYSVHNVLEYYRWYNSAMSFQAAHRFMPLGGNTIFVRTDMLKKSNGWPETLTEDCSLGVLLSTRYNAKTAVYYEPRLATREETPDTLVGLFRQRVRWNQGFFHEWLQGVWRELPTFRQRVLANYVLLSPIILGAISVLMLFSLLAAFLLSAPVVLVMMMYLSLIPCIMLVIINAVFLKDFGEAFDRKIRLRHYMIVLLTSVFYQVVLNTAAFWSIIRQLRGDQSWYKTTHTGMHRQTTSVSAAAFEGGVK